MLNAALGTPIPEVGGILSSIVGTLWPDDPPRTCGLELGKKSKPSLTRKSKTLCQASGETIRTQWIATNTVYVTAASEFMNSKYEWVLGPLFAIFSVLHMTLLRDCMLHGQGWGWSQDDFKVYVQFTKDTLDKYLAYFDKVLKNRHDVLAPGQPSLDEHKTDVYQYWQPYNQQSVVAFDDYRLLVTYLDPFEHPDPTPELPFQDAYSPAYGTADDWDATASGWA
ncbi:hypothetical protein MPER_09808, partial [Moniliophthora perniciosa FA553]